MGERLNQAWRDSISKMALKRRLVVQRKRVNEYPSRMLAWPVSFFLSTFCLLPGLGCVWMRIYPSLVHATLPKQDYPMSLIGY